MNDSIARETIEPITVEVIGSALSSIVEEMGEALVRASYSTNIKERRDCSTAPFDTAGKRIPPIRLSRAGELQHDVMELILLNGLVLRERFSDFCAQMAATGWACSA